MKRPEEGHGGKSVCPARPAGAELSPEIMALADRQARQLVAAHPSWNSDFEDLRQDILVELVRRMPNCDPSIAPPIAFARKALKDFRSKLLRRRFCPTARMEKGFARYFEPQADEEPKRVNRPVWLRDHVDPSEEVILRLSVAEVLSRLPADLRTVAELLKEHSLAAVAHRLGISNHILNGKIEKLRRIFRAAGLEE